MRKRKKQFRWKCTAFALVLGASLFAAGCGSKDDSSEKEDAVQQDAKADAEDVSTDKTEDTAIDSAVEKAENTLTEKTENTPTPVPATPTEVPGLEFPQKVDGEKLLVESLFQLSSMNPDCDDALGDNVASIQVENASGEYLESADIAVFLYDGTEFRFHLEDVPAGKKILAFDTENNVYDRESGVKEVNAEGKYLAEVSLMEEQITTAVDESGLKLKNISGNTLQNLTVKYHCLFEEMYYGGRSYSKSVDALEPGESIVVETPECYLGEAAVVSLTK